MDFLASRCAVEKGSVQGVASSSKHHGSVAEASITKAARSAVLPQRGIYPQTIQADAFAKFTDVAGGLSGGASVREQQGASLDDALDVAREGQAAGLGFLGKAGFEFGLEHLVLRLAWAF